MEESASARPVPPTKRPAQFRPQKQHAGRAFCSVSTRAHPRASTWLRTGRRWRGSFFSRVRRGRGSWWGTTRAVVGSTRCGGGGGLLRETFVCGRLRVSPRSPRAAAPTRRPSPRGARHNGHAPRRADRRVSPIPAAAASRPRRRFVVPVSTAVPPTPPLADARPVVPTPRRHAAGTGPHAASLRLPPSRPFAAVGRCRCRSPPLSSAHPPPRVLPAV